MAWSRPRLNARSGAIFLKEKAAHRATGRVTQGQGLLGACQGAQLTAHEIHMGLTSVQGLTSPLLVEWSSGHRRADFGTCLHGLFHNRPLRRFILEHVAARKGMDLPATRHDIDQNAEFDKLVAVVRQHLDVNLVYRVIGLGSAHPPTRPIHLTDGTLFHS